MNGQTHLPEPEILTRQDFETGRWDVSACAAKRGVPHTIIPDRVMKVPVDSSGMSRAIRAHEMMHAKVTPAEELLDWFAREVASRDALMAVEELRVNLLCQHAGFDMKGSLSDDGETADGERAVATRDWRSAVFMAVGCVGTASHKKFLTGVRRHDRFWGKCLLDISKRAHRQMEKAYRTGTLARTEIDESSGMAPKGFRHTERIAEWVDRIAAQTPPEPPAVKVTEVRDDPDGADGDDSGDDGERKMKHTNIGTKISDKEEGFGELLKGITADTGEYSGVPHWGKLEIEKLPLTTLVPGTIGKKRIASNTGRHPRRLHRLLTDPQQRIFDRTIKGLGGVLVLDASGSMDLTKKQVRQVLEAAPGVTVLAYTDSGEELPNAWVLANKGRMVDELPNIGHGNGVDLPALEWGVAHRQRPSSPVIWVSDGGVCGHGAGTAASLTMQCIKYVLKHRIIVVPHIEDALQQLRNMKRGQKAKTIWPDQLRHIYRKAMGSSLRKDHPNG